MRTTLAVRLDSAGDVLVTGPAIRALAHGSDRLLLLTGPRGAGAARLLPDVDEVLEWHCPWIDPEPLPVDRDDVMALVERLAACRIDRAVVFTSFHQSPLPTALLVRMAGVPHVSAISEDYPGSLLDVRHRTRDDQHEVTRALGLARAAGFEPPARDDGLLHVRHPLPVPPTQTPAPPYVVLHPGTSVPARAWLPERWEAVAAQLTAAGTSVVVTGGPDETVLTARVSGGAAVDLGGLTPWAELASVLAGAEAVVVGNTGPAHLAAAVGTPVVSLFAPTVPPVRWAPYGVPSVMLGDQDAPCRDTRVTRCPFPGHPCLASVTPEAVVEAVTRLCGAAGGPAATQPGQTHSVPTRPDPTLQEARA
jgi:ADP-heptose:LPS heptosyltransferase